MNKVPYNVFYPKLVTADDMTKVMGEEFWSTIVTLNATMGFQVANYKTKISSNGKRQAGVGMVNSAGVAAFSLAFGPMTTKKNKYQGDGVNLVNLGGGLMIKSKNTGYINRAINTSAELRSYLTNIRDHKDFYSEAVKTIVDGYRSNNRADSRYISCTTTQDTAMIKKIYGQEPLNIEEQGIINELLERYEREVVTPNKTFHENHQNFFSRERCVFLNTLQFSGDYTFGMGVLDPKAFMKGGSQTVNWFKPVKLYKSLHDIEDNDLRAALFSRLVMVKLRYKESMNFYDADKLVPAFQSNVADGLTLVRCGYNDKRSLQSMLVNLG